ncbi:leucine-rich repeat domain-containing protein [Ekhidna sp.]|uniref:leucine-rich repeat domain-containing protein n=1 Tax=Ekhidna sp. TaxID=2608089 RepID=UPI003B50915B
MTTIKRTCFSFVFLIAFFLLLTPTRAQVNESDSLALIAIYDSLNGPNWNTPWDLTKPIKTWDGVIVVNNKVERIFLNFDNNVSGTLPAVIGELEDLKKLQITGCNLQGDLPSELSNLTKLETLELWSNRLTGQIPDISTLTNLTELNLNFNLLEGPIPQGIGNLVNLTKLDLAQNNLSGDIPSEIGNLTALELLNLSFNELTSVPSEIGNLVSLTDLHLGALNLSTLPNEVGNLVNLKNLMLYGSGISGAFPFDLSQMTALEEFSIRDNNLTGPIPPEVGMLTQLVGLDFSLNQFEGTIPAGIGSLSNIEELYLYGNNIEGSIPTEFKNLTALRKLLIYDNNLSGDVPEFLNTLINLERLDLRNNGFINLPDLSGIESLVSFSVMDNFFEFDDLLPNQTVLSGYAPQGKVDQLDTFDIETGDALMLTAATPNTDGNNTYKWVLDNSFIDGATKINYEFYAVEPGTYEIYYLAENPALPNLFLVSHDIVVNVTASDDVTPRNIELSNHIVLEGQSAATKVGTLSTVDPEENDEHTYALVGGDDINSFFITENILRTNEVFDFDQKSSYQITIRTTDLGGRTLDKTFEISIEEDQSGGSDIMDFDGNGRTGAISFVINDEVYIGLGKDADSLYTDFWKYNTATASWTSLEDFPGTARTDAVAFTIDGIGYVGLGRDAEFNTFSDFYVFDPSAGWSQVSEFGGTPRYDAVSFTIDGVAFVGTGKDDTSETNDFWSYDASTNSWTEVTAMPTDARTSAVAFSIGTKGYVSGGVFFDGSTTQLSDVQEYDPATNEWKEKVFADGINLSFSGATGSASDEEGYIFYGNKEQVTKYDPNTDEITDLGDVFNLGSDRHAGVSFRIGNSIYFGLGSYSEDIFSDPIYPVEILRYDLPIAEKNVAPEDIILENRFVKENVAPVDLGELYTIDQNVSDTHEYALVSGDGDTNNDLFAVSGSILTTNESFNYEEQSLYSIRLQTTDQDGLTFERVFEIEIQDINEPPSELSLDNNEILEGETENTLIGTFTTTDEDFDESFTYTLLSASDSFNIQNDKLYSSVTFDFETQNQYSIEVEVSDSANHTLTKSFAIKIIEINQPPTDISISNAAIEEGFPENSTVGLLTTTDANIKDEHNYEIIEGEEDFSLEGNALIAKRTFNHEEQAEYNVEIQSTDRQGASVTEIFTIQVTDVNEAPTGIVLDNTEINEDEAEGLLVAIISTIDEDEDDSYTYVIRGVSAFSLSNDSLFADRSFDFEEQSSYEVTIRSTDAGGLAIEEDFIITILDQEEPLATDDPGKVFRVYPNPVESKVNFDVDYSFQGKLESVLINAAGKIVHKQIMNMDTNHQSFSIYMSELPQGIYILRLEMGSETLKKRVIKR